MRSLHHTQRGSPFEESLLIKMINHKATSFEGNSRLRDSSLQIVTRNGTSRYFDTAINL